MTANAVDRKLSKNKNFFIKKKIEAKVNEVVVAVIEPISDFLMKEGIPEAAIPTLIDAAQPSIEWLIENEDFSFSRGLDGEVITEDLIAKKINQDSIASDYPSAFETIVRALVDLVTKAPPVFEAWEKSSFQTLFTQLEEIKSTLSVIYTAMNDVASSKTAVDSDFEKLTKHRAATTALKTNIHGLRQTAVAQAELDNLFVFPQFSVGKQLNSKDPEDEDLFSIKTLDNFEEFIEFINESLHVIIRAPAGAGKTTFSNWLSSKLLTSSTRRFPIVFPLRKTLKKGPLPSLREAFSENTSSAFSDLISKDRVSSWADEKKIVVIFEGLDEVSELQREAIIDWIKAMKIAHPNLICIITSRPLSTDHLDALLEEGWRGVSLLPFDADRVVTYISRFQKHGPNIQTGAKLRDPEQLARAWRADQTLEPLTGNPLLLSTLLIVHHMDGELPDDRSKLYDRYIDGMLGLWELNKELETPVVPLTKTQKKKILELIAINMISSENDAASEEDVAKWIVPYLESQNLGASPKIVLDHLRERSGLLIGPGQYTFAHKSIGEFLIAQCCNDGIQVNNNGTRFDRWLLKSNCTKDRWTTVTFLWAGIASTSEVQDFISSLISVKNFSLSAGLILERRKFLERTWLEDAFWSCIKVLICENRSYDENSRAYMSIIAPVASMTPAQRHCELAEVTSINDMQTHSSGFARRCFDEGVANPLDWKDRLDNLSPVIWCLLSNFAPSRELLEKRPEEIPLLAGCYYIVKYKVFGYPLGKDSNIHNIDDIQWISEYCYLALLEALAVIEMFLDTSAEYTDDNGRRRFVSNDYNIRIFENIERCGAIKRTKEKFFDKKSPELEKYLDEESPDFFASVKATRKPKTLREKIEISLKVQFENDSFTTLKDLVRGMVETN